MRARLAAWHVLRGRTPLTRRALRAAADEAALDALDRRVFARTLGAEVRRRGALRAITEHFSERKSRPDLAVFAQVGLAQLLFVEDIPDHAAISETTEAARTALGERPAKYVHALLRRVQREVRPGTSGDPQRDVPLADIHFEKAVFADPIAHWLVWAEQALNMPVPIGRRWRNRLGDETAARLALASLLAPNTANGKQARRVTARAVELLGANQGERVLNLGVGVRAASRLARTPAHVVTALAAKPASDFEATFDAAFVHAPSTCTGVLAERPAERWRFDAPHVAELARIQTARLAAAADAVRPGGRIVYTTASIEPDENERRVRAFLADRADWKLDAEFALQPEIQPELQASEESDASIYADGGYGARLLRA